MFKSILDLAVYKAIILDFDGVIIDSEKAQINAWKLSFKKHNVILNAEKLVDTIGMRDEEIIKLLAPGKSLEKYHSNLLETKVHETNEMYKSGKIGPIEDVIEFIERKKNTHILSIATNSSSNEVWSYCKSINIDKYFKYIVTGDGLLKPKPYPDIYNKVIEILNLPRNACIAVEDSIIGLESAKNAGLKSIGFANIHSKHAIQKHADWVVNTFAEL